MSIRAALAFLLVPAAAMAEEAPRQAQPVVLETETSGSDVVVRVVGRADRPVEAGYALEVSSGATSNNRSVQRGRATLEPGREVGLISLRLAGAARENWVVTLKVDTGEGSYELENRAG